MKSLSVLFPLFRDYRLNLASNASLNALGAILSLFSFLSVVPFLRILFGGVTTHADDIPGRIGEWFDNYVVGVGTTHALLMVCISVVVLAVLKNLVSYLAMYSLATIRTGVSRDLRNNMYKRVLGQTMGWFTNSRKGDVLSRLTVDLNEVEVSIVGSVEVMFKSPLIVFISIAALFALSWELTIFALVFLPVSGVLISRIAKKLKHSALKGKEIAVRKSSRGLAFAGASGTEFEVSSISSSLSKEATPLLILNQPSLNALAGGIICEKTTR